MLVDSIKQTKIIMVCQRGICSVSKIKRSEMWRQQYRNHRYMEHLNIEELQQRAKGIYLNILVLTPEAKLGPVSLDDGGGYWMILFTHVLEEFKLRFGPYPAGFLDGFMKDVKIPDPTSPIALKAAEIVNRHNLQPGTYLAKFGKRCHIQAALERGAIRIFPASFYDNSSFNPAIRDKELQLSIQVHPSTIGLTITDKKTMKPTKIKPIGNIEITQKSLTDYYIYCMTSVLVPRLFLDFEKDGYDTCLIITKPRFFLNSLLNAFAKILPAWECAGIPVLYIDPLNAKEQDLNVFYSKHFRYTYQKEYRTIWLPPNHVKKLHYIDVKLDDLHKYCESISII
jgi:hypothetical protein